MINLFLLKKTFIKTPYFIVFIVNFCIMTLELVAGRIIAPYVGVSLYTWTAVIGIVLLGMTIGSFYGGKIVDKSPKKELLGLILICAGFFSSLTLLFLKFFGFLLSTPSIPYLLQVFSITLFFLFPSILLGMISPFIIKLHVKNLKTAGDTVGKIYAAASFGSIIGTYATGFFLIPYLGTQLIITVISIMLFLLAFSYISISQFLLFFKKNRIFGFFIFSIIFLNVFYVKPFCTYESAYYCIRILEGEYKYLMLDNVFHSQTDLKNPLSLEFDYEKLFAVFYEYYKDEKPQSLFLGGGAYTIQRYLVHTYKNPKATVVEIDPVISQIAFTDFDMPESSSVISINEDARIFLKNLSLEKKYTLIFGDAFSSFSIPYHLTTKEFNQLLKKHLYADGLYVVNVIDTKEKGLFLGSYMHTLSQVFNHMYLFQPLNTEDSLGSNYIVVAGDRRIDEAKLKKILTKLNYEDTFKMYMQEEIKNLVKKEGVVTLTDDYVPVDNMISSVYTNK